MFFKRRIYSKSENTKGGEAHERMARIHWPLPGARGKRPGRCRQGNGAAARAADTAAKQGRCAKGGVRRAGAKDAQRYFRVRAFFMQSVSAMDRHSKMLQFIVQVAQTQTFLVVQKDEILHRFYNIMTCY